MSTYWILLLVYFIGLVSANFPAGVEHVQTPYASWSGSVNITSPILVTYPKNAGQVLNIVNWGYRTGRKVRAQGYRHGFSPLTVTPKDDPENIVLIDTTKYLTKISMVDTIHGISAVEAGPGATMENLLEYLEQNGFGIVMAPEIGNGISIGGILAIGGHGAGIPAVNEKLKGSGFTFGSVSNLVAELDVVVWNATLDAYSIKTFQRSNPEIGPYIVHIGRALITRVVLFVGENYNMRCLNRLDIPGAELFQNPTDEKPSPKSLSSLLDTFGRVDISLFPFVNLTAIKLWDVTNIQPNTSRMVKKPYNYQFGVSFTARENILKSYHHGLTKTNAWDVWGPSKNTILYSKFGPAPVVAAGFIILTNRHNIQDVVYKFTEHYENLLKINGDKNFYPVDYLARIRVTGLDVSDFGMMDAVNPIISPLSPVMNSSFNAGIWVNIIYSLNHSESTQFMDELEKWVYYEFNGTLALARPEWSKLWGFSKEIGGFSSVDYMKLLPLRFGVQAWDKAVTIFDKYDPHKVFTNELLRKLLVVYK